VFVAIDDRFTDLYIGLCKLESCFDHTYNLSNRFPVIKKTQKKQNPVSEFLHIQKKVEFQNKKTVLKPTKHALVYKCIARARSGAPVGLARSSAPAAPTTLERTILPGALERARRIVARERATLSDAFERTLVSHSNAMQFT